MNKIDLFQVFFKQVFQEYYEEDNSICFQIDDKYKVKELEEKLKKFGWKKNSLWVVPIGLKMELEEWFNVYLGVTPKKIILQVGRK